MTQAGDPQLLRKTSPAEGSFQVALYGRDGVLLSYRNQVLCWAGFTTAVLISPFQELDSIPCAPVVVLCHSLTVEDRKEVLSKLRTRCARSKVIALTSSSRPIRDNLPYDALVECLAGPDTLIKAVNRLLDNA